MGFDLSDYAFNGINPILLNYLIGLVGPSGSGKTTLINHAVRELEGKIKVVKSTSTRSRRDTSDDSHYEFISEPDFKARKTQGKFYNVEHFAGNWYGTDKDHINEVLLKCHGIMAIAETAVAKMQLNGFPIKVVKINPAKEFRIRAGRADADLDRQKIPIKVDFEIENSFDPGGLGRATRKLVGYIKTLP